MSEVQKVKRRGKEKPGERGICKQYYETGYCIFGDACKFLHVRKQSDTRVEARKKNACAQCGAPLKPGETCIPKCGHKICLSCVQSGAKACPVCKSSLVDSDVQVQ